MENVVAVCWDVDKTLTFDYSETPLFDYYCVDQKSFWNENKNRIEMLKSKGYGINEHVYYLNLILEYVRKGTFKGLNNSLLRELGKSIEFFPGAIEFLEELKQINGVENYLISSGLKRMIEGSDINKHVEGVYACEFVDDTEIKENVSGSECSRNFHEQCVVHEIGFAYDGPAKMNALKEIHEGTNKSPLDINDVDTLKERIDYKKMIYIGDGSTDVPCWDFLMERGGHCFGVYGANIESDPRPVNKSQIIHLYETGRIHGHGPADYRKGTSTHDYIYSKVKEMASM